METGHYDLLNCFNVVFCASANQDVYWHNRLYFQLAVTMALTRTACFPVTVLATVTVQEAVM